MKLLRLQRKTRPTTILKRKRTTRPLFWNAHHPIVGFIIEHQKIDTSKLIHEVTSGFKVFELDALQKSLGVPMEILTPYLGISKTTLHRRRKTGRLDQAESDRIVRYAKLLSKAIETLETSEAARKWITSPQYGLGGATPLDYAKTEIGAREVENLLGRIDTGVYS